MKKDCTFDVKPREDIHHPLLDCRTAGLQDSTTSIRKMRGRMGEEETKRRRDEGTARPQDSRTAGQHDFFHIKMRGRMGEEENGRRGDGETERRRDEGTEGDNT